MSSKVKVTHGLIHQGPARVTPGQAQRNTLNRTIHIQKLSICWSAFPKWSRIHYLTLRKKGSCSEEFRPGMENPLVGCSLRATWTRYRCSEQGSSHKLPDRDAEMWQEGEDFHVKEAGWNSTSKLVKAQTEIGTTANPFCHEQIPHKSPNDIALTPPHLPALLPSVQYSCTGSTPRIFSQQFKASDGDRFYISNKKYLLNR